MHRQPPTTALWLSDSTLDSIHGEHQKTKEPKKSTSKKSKKQQEYEYRRQQWLDRYGSLEALQATFGTGQRDNSTHTGFFGGDLSPEQTRRLYHTLLPRSLLALYEMGVMNPEELAPMAYEARMAAKLYARSRCVWYARVATEAFDQYRNLRDRGRLRLPWRRQRNTAVGGKQKSSGMTWDEIYSKYEAQIVQEECEKILQKYNDTDAEKMRKKTQKKIESLKDDKDLTMSIYTRILERSCVTNQAFDKMFLTQSCGTDDECRDEQDVLNRVAQQLDQDVRDILLGPKDTEKAAKEADKLQSKEQKAQEKAQRKQEKQLQKEQERLEKEKLKRAKKIAKEYEKFKEQQQSAEEEEETVLLVDDDDDDMDTEDDLVEGAGALILASSGSTSKNTTNWQVLRVLAGTRKKFRDLPPEEDEQ